MLKLDGVGPVDNRPSPEKLHHFVKNIARIANRCPSKFCSTLHISESIWPPPFSTGVCRNEEPSPEGQRDKEISLSQFISSLFEGVGQLLPGDFAGLLMSRPRLLAAGDSCCQKVPQRFSGSIQGDALTNTYLGSRESKDGVKAEPITFVFLCTSLFYRIGVTTC